VEQQLFAGAGAEFFFGPAPEPVMLILKNILQNPQFSIKKI
jgi:hypothetical protein